MNLLDKIQPKPLRDSLPNQLDDRLDHRRRILLIDKIKIIQFPVISLRHAERSHRTCALVVDFDQLDPEPVIRFLHRAGTEAPVDFFEVTVEER